MFTFPSRTCQTKTSTSLEVLAGQREENANAPKQRGREQRIHEKKSVTRETLRWLGSPKFGIPSPMMEHFFGKNRKKTKDH